MVKIKCATCQKELEIPDEQFDIVSDYYCGIGCEAASRENLLRAIFGKPVVVPKKKAEPGPTEGEIEFLEKEIQLMVKNYRLEDSEEAIEKLFLMTSKLIERGVIEKSPEGIGKGWDMIFKECPDLKHHFDKFNAILRQETLKEKKQRERPN